MIIYNKESKQPLSVEINIEIIKIKSVLYVFLGYGLYL